MKANPYKIVYVLYVDFYFTDCFILDEAIKNNITSKQNLIGLDGKDWFLCINWSWMYEFIQTNIKHVLI